MTLRLLSAFVALAFCSAQAEDHRLESLLLLPEPKIMRNSLSFFPEGAELTVLTPAKELKETPWVMPYRPDEFKQLGLSVETFAERAKKAADKRLATLKPELIKNAEGQVAYAVYRSDQPLMASLLVAPSLPAIFEKLFGDEIWVALPDRHSLFVFPARPEAIEEFAADLEQRYLSDTRAASPEIFAIKKGGVPKVVASFLE
ncbi:hypothetical protein SAMN02745166_02597 [Prosthecobacter debontii]|uniref:DUF1444 family protein n=1 Tax=Prosthecobacter debontii TaxID=48467 RepID=A0A1T4Y663_9BACT|nr:hypothetical protein [Prosthecobacter debontii]SKA97334.1 hypothetical protein SAMN02745166_02597 [Prosthecobacter debontii]